MQFQNIDASCGTGTSGVNDARKAVRYTLRARAVFSWTDRAGLPQQGRGETRDISPKGAYVFSSCCPPRGVVLAVTIYLPTLEGENRILSIQAEGKVLRVEPSSISGNSAGFSMQHERVALCTD
jgi:hypothetical protein